MGNAAGTLSTKSLSSTMWLLTSRKLEIVKYTGPEATAEVTAQTSIKNNHCLGWEYSAIFKPGVARESDRGLG